MKRLIIFFLCTLSIIGIKAQKLSVENFALKPNDLSARTKPRQDNNGTDCALVKVQIAASGVTFAGNVIGETSFKSNEYWVYMTEGSKRLKVVHPSYLPLEVTFADYDVTQLKSRTTYILTIALGDLPQGVQQPKIQTGWIILDSEPTDALVFINDEYVGNTPLTNYKQAYGTYSYRVECPNYHPSTGTIELNSSKIEQKIKLKPAFGSIAITCSVTGANILLDGKATNKVAPCTLEEVPSGQHTITIQKDKYSPRQQSVNVEDGQTAQLSISLDARFAQVSITSLDAAQIYCNGKRLGTTKLVEDMMEGFYDLEVRLNHHKPATKQIQVHAGQPQEITINPIPIYGSLDITSTPHDADVTIDGKHYGKTPLTVEQLLEGEHKIVLSKEGFLSMQKDVIVQEKEVINESVNLQGGWVIKVGPNESLATKLNRITGNTDVLLIQGPLKKEDWKALGQFCKSKKVKSLTFKDYSGLTEIGDYYFQFCSNLSSFNIPDGVTSIGECAFRGCHRLKTVSIPNSVTSIGYGAFDNCEELSSINIPNNIVKIGNFAFRGCTGLTSISVEEGNITYDSRDNCNAIISTKNNTLIQGCKTTIIPNSVVVIGLSAFGGCKGLTSITIPSSVTKIEELAFSDCTSLTSVRFPNSLKKIESCAFKDCTKLNYVSISSDTVVEPSAFVGCPYLTITKDKNQRQGIEPMFNPIK